MINFSNIGTPSYSYVTQPNANAGYTSGSPIFDFFTNKEGALPVASGTAVGAANALSNYTNIGQQIQQQVANASLAPTTQVATPSAFQPVGNMYGSSNPAFAYSAEGLSRGASVAPTPTSTVTPAATPTSLYGSGMNPAQAYSAENLAKNVGGTKGNVVNNSPGFFSQAWEGIGGMEGLGQIANVGMGVLGIMQGMEMRDLAMDKFNFQKDAWTQNFNMQKDAYDRQVARQDSVNDFLRRKDTKEE